MTTEIKMSPFLAGIAEVIPGDGDYASRLVSKVNRGPGALVAKMEGCSEVPQRSYTTVQVSETQDIELNSDLVFCNHSCDPNVAFDVNKFEVRVLPNRSLKPGDDITFFYPSTEWDMEQPFNCTCGTTKCLGTIEGANHMDVSKLENYWLNEHIKQLLASRASSRKGSTAGSNSD